MSGRRHRIAARPNVARGPRTAGSKQDNKDAKIDPPAIPEQSVPVSTVQEHVVPVTPESSATAIASIEKNKRSDGTADKYSDTLQLGEHIWNHIAVNTSPLVVVVNFSIGHACFSNRPDKKIKGKIVHPES